MTELVVTKKFKKKSKGFELFTVVKI